ncbi:hypothetical protein HZ994_01090 [Akkermansiaceae bacterium]|nr:hypothetical protein HZ994_01090 [Akkermansiaceae bacterium]
MREPVYEDPKASRWADLYQRRARLTGELPEPEILARFGIPADDPFWKEDNANPWKGFAVNLSVPMASALQAAGPGDMGIVGRDDFGRSVTNLPLAETSPRFYFGFEKNMYRLEGTGRSIAISEFIWKVSRVFRELLLKAENEPEEIPEEDDDEEEEEIDEPMSYSPADYTIHRISWNPRQQTWYVMTERTAE